MSPAISTKDMETKEDIEDMCFFCLSWGGGGVRIIKCWEAWGWLDLKFRGISNAKWGMCANSSEKQCLESILERSSSLWPRISSISQSNHRMHFSPTWRLDVRRFGVLTSWPNRKFGVKLVLGFVELREFLENSTMGFITKMYLKMIQFGGPCSHRIGS